MLSNKDVETTSCSFCFLLWSTVSYAIRGIVCYLQYRMLPAVSYDTAGYVHFPVLLIYYRSREIIFPP